MSALIDWLNDYGHAVLVGCWIISTITAVMLLYPVYDNWRYRRQHRAQLRIAARVHARFAVFDSYVRGGGRQSDLGREIELQLRDEQAAYARSNGEDYYRDYVTYETEADNELAVLMKITEAENEEG